MERRLSDILGYFPAGDQKKITGLTADSRAVRPGFVFAALCGLNFDGRDYIPDAIKAGAVAILTTDELVRDAENVSLIIDSNPRRKYSEMLARFYNRQPTYMAAVTGTNGKSSVAEFCRQIWVSHGSKAASLGTIGVIADGYKKPGGLTTPDPADLHATLADLSDFGISHAAMEVSSHGLSQFRADGVAFQVAGFTNLSRDHLDYHGTMTSYFLEKARLFGDILKPGGTAVVHGDDQWSRQLVELCRGRGIKCFRVGMFEGADIQLLSSQPHPLGQSCVLRHADRSYDVEIPLIGSFQVENIMVAMGLVMASGLVFSEACQAISNLTGVPGRMERVGETSSGGLVYVDYAHTPAGLETVLKAARAHNPAKLHVVFGCGGDRDKGKRPEMGAISNDYADEIWIADDNPRSEDAGTIRSEIISACPSGNNIGDRAAAIKSALDALSHDDILIIAGKGHEEGQIVGDAVLPFSDVKTAQDYIAHQKGDAR